MKQNYGCVLLSGGAGRRLGHKNKAELKYEDRTFQERIAEELRKSFDVCYLSTAVYDQEVPEGFRKVPDDITDENGDFIGPMGGICTCLKQAKADGLTGLFFAPCDAPFFRVEILEKLATHVDDDVDIAMWLTEDGRLQTAFGYYAVSALPQTEAEIAQGHYQILRVLDHVRTRLIDVSREEIPLEWFANINRLEEYDALLRHEENKPERRKADSLSPEEAVSALLAHVEPLSETERLPIMSARGRVLAEDVAAPYDQPAFSRSPLDGYALRAEDTDGASKEQPRTLNVIGEVSAGGVFAGTVRAGEAVRIMTGAPIPDGADAILRQEDTDYGETEVRVYRELKPWQNYIFKGEDFRQGDILLRKGDLLGPNEIGYLAGLGRAEVAVYRPVRILLLSTGDELQMPGTPLADGKIYNSNLFATASQLEAWGCEVLCHHVPDDPKQAVRLIRESIDRVDLVLSTGGVSVGKKDIMHEVFGILGAHRIFWKIALKPGMAMLAGEFEHKLILSLSGNPYAAYVDLHLLVRPVLAAMARNERLLTTGQTATLQEDYNKRSPGRRMVRANVVGGTASIAGHTGGNGDFASSLHTNALVDIPAGTSGLTAGQTVSVILL